MHFSKTHILIVMGCLWITQVAYCQSKSNRNRSSIGPRTNSRPNKASIICPIFNDKLYPYQGIGLKLGDPFALTYKFYASKSFAIAIDAGETASGLYNEYYRDAFMDYMPDSLSAGETMQHLSHKVTTNIFLEGKALYQWDADVISNGLHLYAGAGWQWRNANIRYEYLYSEESTGISYTSSIIENRFTYGPVVLLGFEYAYFSIPISAFIEIEWFTDVALDPGYSRFQGGVGLRYVF